MTDVLPLSVSQEQYDRIRQADAVVVNKYSGSGGMFTRLARIGTVAECEDYIATPSLLIIPSGLEYLGSEVVLAGDLLPPAQGDMPLFAAKEEVKT